MQKYLLPIYLFCIVSTAYTQNWQKLRDEAIRMLQNSDYEKAQNQLEQALKEVENAKLTENVVYGEVFHYLAIACEYLGKYSQAETYYQKALDVRLKLLGRLHKDYSITLNNLALLYEKMGKYEEAEKLYQETLQIKQETFGKRDLSYAISCNNLALLYQKMGEYEKAEKLFLEAMNIRKALVGEKHPEFAQSCNNLGGLYEKTKNYEQAQSYYQKAVQIFEENFGEMHLFTGYSYNNLALLYFKQNKFDLASTMYEKARKAFEKVLGDQHPVYGTVCFNLGSLRKAEKKFEEAETWYRQSGEITKKQIKVNFVGLSEKEKDQFLNNFRNRFEVFTSFATEYKEAQLLKWIFENYLFTKGMLFFSTNKLRRSIENSNDKALQELYQRWLSKRKELSRAYEIGLQRQKEQGIDLKEFEKEVNAIEKQISWELAQKGILIEFTPPEIFFEEVYQKLEKNEALVEISRIRYYAKEWTDSILYVALVAKKTHPYPEIIVFHRGKYLENEAVEYYRNMINYRKEDKLSYQNFFEPLKKHLKGVKRLYFSADGVYHQINLATLYNPSTRKYLNEEFEIRLINTARDFLYANNNKQVHKAVRNICLVGYPAFTKKTSSAAAFPQQVVSNNEQNFSSVVKNQRFWDRSSNTVATLPGTRAEVASIKEIAQKAHIPTFVFIEEKASEENLKALNAPSILHLATHGFFIDTQEKIKNPLLRSGLLLAGAENTLKNENLEGENGILTAQEVMNLNLQGTDLVVLSACETGLGEIKNGEGVLGLQRALQEAGAKNVLMSLWKVDDQVTQEMMTIFYKNMLIKKQNKHLAFKNAQKAIKKKYKYPYYWGAFVIVGE